MYRLRVEDTYFITGERIGYYADPEAPPPLLEFQQYLDKAEKAKVLPSWWNKGAKNECMTIAMKQAGVSYISAAVEKGAIRDEYGDNMMPMKMRMTAEAIFGKSVETEFLEGYSV